MRRPAVCFVAVCCLFATPLRADVTGDLAALPLVAEKFQGNRDALRTWRGKAAVRFEWFADGVPEWERVMTHDVEFVCDVATGWRRWVVRTRGGANTHIDDAVKRPRPPMEHRGLVQGDTFAEMVGFPVGAKPFRVVIHLRDAGADQSSASPVRFDPVAWLDRAGGDLAAAAKSYHDLAKELDNAWTVRREKDLVTIELAKPDPRGRTLNQYVIDLSRGGSLVSFRAATEGRGETLYEYDYERVAGVWVPERASFRLSTVEAGRLVVKRLDVAEFLENRVNERLEPGEFSWEAMGVPDGCPVFDERPERANSPDRQFRYEAKQKVSNLGASRSRRPS